MATTIGSLDLNAFSDLYSDSTQYFWFESNASATYGAGAHVTLVPDTSFISNPTGQNILMNTDGFSIRNGLLPMMTLDNDSLDFNVVNTTAGTYVTTATFTSTGAQIGQSTNTHLELNTNGLNILNGTLPMMTLDNDSLDFNVVDTTAGTYVTTATFGSTGATIGQTNGAHIQISSSGLDVNLNSSTNIASFGINGAQIGQSETAHSVIDANGQRFYGGSDGTTQLANIGYGETAGESGAIDAPFYTFGIRQGATATDYDPTVSYFVGAFCYYNGVLYICVEETTPPETWDSTKWKRAVGSYSVVEGTQNTASGYCSHAEGESTTASGHYSHAEGYNTNARENWSHAEGDSTTASGYYSHAEGHNTTASGSHSHAQNYNTTASGFCSHAQNYSTIAAKDNQTAIGKYNIEDTASATADQKAFIIGNGTSDTARSNALTVDWNGKIQTPQMQAGTIAATSVSANSYTDVSVTFPSAMSGTPIVVCGVVSTSTAGAIGSITAAVTSTSTTGFTCRIFNAGSIGRTPAVNWIALNV